MADDEPFDSIGGNGPSKKLSTPNAPPSFAFDHGGNVSVPARVPPPNVFPNPAAISNQDDGEDELGAIPTRPRTTEPSIMSTELNDRWKQYETTMDNHRSESSLENSRTTMDPVEASPQEESHRLSAGFRTELAPRQPYAIRNSQSYDTDELIRKYGGISGVPAVMSNARPSMINSSALRAADVRDQAQKMIELVDDHLKTPVDVRRTESGGFRAAPSILPDEEEGPYSFRRSSSAGKRVPAALAGLNFSKPANTWKESGRYSFKDPSYRDDDHFSDEEDNIIRHDGPFEDEPVVDVVAMESRAAVARPYTDEKKFEGDFEGGSKTWSSRYSDTAAYVSQKHILDQWDREFEQEQGRKSARNMFMSTANDIRSTATNAWSAVGGQKQQIFGSGGFSFRTNHVFGNHMPASERDETSLRAAWKEVEDAPSLGPPPVHKTWQEVMLNKRKRRRIVAILVLLVLVAVAVSSAVSAIKNRQDKTSMFAGSNVGHIVTFYVTSDSPFDSAAEDRLTKDLENIPMDSEFVIHLGNIQDASVSMCPKTRYNDIASVLAESPVPLFIVPGADDWTKCPAPETALSHWMSAFEDFDLKFKHGLPVKRDRQNPEAFAFLHLGVLFMGLHIVSGPVVDDDDVWVARQKEMLKFYYGIANLNKGNFRSVVLMGNARPSAQQTVFFNTLFSNLKDHHAPIVYIHANERGDEVLQHYPFESRKDILAIGVHDGSSHPPLKITVGFGEQPFTVG